ncbi:hypothetical protein [Reinekea sp. G2M2-21]|uniref:hypothetical protein n=1 Tax=Reinekea sp. G2M2-21 TaxID=2788942 RepID=UPI0018AABEA1|nr:hypothetical protein [Reinekea sp. G2M2-21]
MEELEFSQLSKFSYFKVLVVGWFFGCFAFLLIAGELALYFGDGIGIGNFYMSDGILIHFLGWPLASVLFSLPYSVGAAVVTWIVTSFGIWFYNLFGNLKLKASHGNA